MKKRLLALTVAMIMAASALVACNDANAGSGSASGNGSDGGSTDENGPTNDDIVGDTDYVPVPIVKADPIWASSSDVSNDDNEYADETGEFVIWGWNTDISNILDGVYADANPDNYARIRFVNTGGSDTYQTKIDEVIVDPTNADYPDLMGLEVDYVQKYVNTDYLLTAEDLGVTADDAKDMYDYNTSLASDLDGNVKAFFWQATPGCFQVRADLAEEYLGTTDPQELHDQYFCDVDTIIATAQSVFEASEGEVALFSGYDEMLRMFQNSRTVGWYDANDKVLIDTQMKLYMETAAAIAPYTYKTAQWSTDWYAAMNVADGDGMAAIAFCGCPWFSYWCLDAEWNANTILVEGPFQFFWGGTGLAATVGCCDRVMAADIIKSFTCDADFMAQINTLNGDFVNNSSVNGGNPEGSAWSTYNNQDAYAFYKPMADGINADTITGEDQDINGFFGTQVDAVANGTKDVDTALEDFKAAVVDKFTYLSMEY